jgi:hypothetical protein
MHSRYWDHREDFELIIKLKERHTLLTTFRAKYQDKCYHVHRRLDGNSYFESELEALQWDNHLEILEQVDILDLRKPFCF